MPSGDATPDDPALVTATVFGKRRRVRMVSPIGYYHIQAEAADGGRPGCYAIMEGNVAPEDREKFRQFAMAWTQPISPSAVNPSSDHP